MHLHYRLKERVIDCGPVHAFWCFSFERFNGILGTTQVYGRSVETELMRKLMAERFFGMQNFQMNSKNIFCHFLPKYESHDLYEDLVVEYVTKLFSV